MQISPSRLPQAGEGWRSLTLLTAASMHPTPPRSTHMAFSLPHACIYCLPLHLMCFNTSQELVEAIVLPIQHKDRFEKLGIRPPKGVLLYGAPGTGKTLLARACAAQTNATFLKLAGPQLVQMFIGDGAKMVRLVLEGGSAGGGRPVCSDPRRGCRAIGLLGLGRSSCVRQVEGCCLMQQRVKVQVQDPGPSSRDAHTSFIPDVAATATLLTPPTACCGPTGA